MVIRWPAVLATTVLLGCGPAPLSVDRSGPLAFEVTFVGDPGGANAESALPFPAESLDLEIAIQAIGYDHAPMPDFTATLALKATPAALSSAPFVDMVAGRASTTVTVARGFGEVRIWASDEGTAEAPGSFASGVSPGLHFRWPTVQEVQRSDSTVESPMEGTYVHMRGWQPAEPDPRDLLVTTVTNDGFYATDFSDPEGSYNSMFAFTFSRPDGIEPGMRLGRLSGIVEEFLGFTELGFPDWEVVEAGVALPEPALLDPGIVCDEDVMERYESSVVRVGALESSFGGIADCEDYNEFGQWPATLLELKRPIPARCGEEDARVNVVNVNTVPSFAFPECADFDRPEPRGLSGLTGVLRHNRYASPAWLVEVRNCLDFPAEARPDDCVSTLRLPLSGPRKAPQWQFRDIPACEGHLTHR